MRATPNMCVKGARNEFISRNVQGYMNLSLLQYTVHLSAATLIITVQNQGIIQGKNSRIY